MIRLNYCIQCRTPEGKTGTFGYSGRDASGAFIPCTPVFSGLVEFYAWAKAQGWIENDTHDLNALYMVMPSSVEAEVASRLDMGCRQLTKAGIVQELAALGYQLDLHTACTGTATDCTSGRTYPCITNGVREIDTKMSAFHFEARRDDKFKALQQLRLDVFAVVGGKVWTL